MKAGVIGYPVSHSLSPVIFNFLSKHFQIPLEYDLYEVPSSELKPFFDANKNHIGFNLTIPHKETILNFLDDKRAVEQIGACNVVKIEDAKWIGYNTDVFGIEKTLEEFSLDIKNKDVTILGAGGAARAAIVACKNARNITVSGRNKNRLEKLKKDFNIQVSEEITKADLYINATPELFDKNDSLVFDMNYRKKGSLGLHMLIWQALKTWEIWFPQLIQQTNLYSLKIQIFKLLEKHL